MIMLYLGCTSKFTILIYLKNNRSADIIAYCISKHVKQNEIIFSQKLSYLYIQDN